MRELERFGRERSAEYIAMMENFAATQVGGGWLDGDWLGGEWW